MESSNYSGTDDSDSGIETQLSNLFKDDSSNNKNDCLNNLQSSNKIITIAMWKKELL